LQTWRQSKNVWQRFCYRFLKRPLLTVSRSFMNVANSALWMMAIILKANKFNLFVSSVLFVFLYHSPNFLDTPRILVFKYHFLLHILSYIFFLLSTHMPPYILIVLIFNFLTTFLNISFLLSN
jgi:hypothetical protein